MHAQALSARVGKQYEEIHEDFRHHVQDALYVFQQSVFKQYLEAEFDAFKEAVARFAKAQSNRIGEVSAYAQSLFNRVHAQYDHLHHDLRHSAQDALDSFQSSVKLHLEQLFGPIPLQIQELD